MYKVMTIIKIWKYSVNTINKKHLNIPRCRINPKKKDLEKLHVVPWVLL